MVMEIFDATEAPYLAVVNDEGEWLGRSPNASSTAATPNEMEKAHREVFGE